MQKVKLRKIMVATIFVGSMLTMVPRTVYAQWTQSQDGSWSYTDNDNVIIGWKLIDGVWYNFDSQGTMRTGWIKEGERWYFTDTSGAMRTGWIKDGERWYFTDTSGAMKTGWVKDGEKWYFSDASGEMQTGVVEVEGKIYSLAASGEMQTGKVIIEGKEYIFANTGEAIGNIPSITKSFDNSGKMDKNLSVLSNQNIADNNNRSNNKSNKSGNSSSNNNNVEQDKWNLVWSDEFNSTSLDESKWNYQYGNGSLYGVTDWGNNEEEYYTKNNVKVADGNLIIDAKKEESNGKNYTSGRIRTLGKFSKTYGKVEAAITLPKGQGLWPAFWMLPVDDNIYGPWASGGEIDIMEARGRVPNAVDGTIHFGQPWPNNKSNGGHYVFPEGEDIGGKHVYSIEWEPGEIRWYVDGKLYHTANDWYSQNSGEPAPYPYPAPFNKDFYIILNLALGGNYDGKISPNDSDLPAEMKVDYVRVYDLKGDYPIHEKPILVDKDLEGARQPLANGSYILDPKFEHIVDSSGKDLSYDNWNFLTANGGAATFDNTSGLKINITNPGDVGYAVQLIDHMPLRTNKTYAVKFKAKADSNRTITAQFGGGPERSWSKYSDLNVVNLTNQLQEYEYSFDMKEQSDVHGRLELNLGTNATGVYITDVEVTEKDTVVDPNATKQPLADGNYVYNGKFNLGDDSKEFWNFAGNGIFNINQNGEAEINVASIGEKQSVTLSQPGMNLLKNDTYKLIFTAKADKAGQIDGEFKSLDETSSYGQQSFDVTTVPQTYEYEFTMPQDVTDEKAVIKFLLGKVDGKVYIDDIRLERLTNNNIDWDNIDSYPLKNGDFSGDFTNWNQLTGQEGSDASFAIENGAASVNIVNLGAEGWNNMLYSNSMGLVKGMDYVLKFDAWSDEARDIIAKIENSGYASCFEKTITLGNEKQHFEYEFKMTSDDSTEQLKFLLGTMNNAKNTKVYIDNVLLKVKNTPFKMAPALTADNTENKLGQDITIRYVGGEDGWKENISSIYINGSIISSDLYSVSGDSIILNSSCFNNPGDNDIVIKSNGYANTKVSQYMKSNSSLIIENGTFDTDTTGWKTYTGDGSDAAVTSVDGEMKVDFPNYAGWQKWSTQVYQDKISLEAGKKYELKFDAGSTVARDAWVEMNNMDQQVITLKPENKTFTYEFTAANTISDGKLNFLLGTNNIDGALFAKNQSVTIDNVSIKEIKDTPNTTTTTGASVVINGDFSGSTIDPWSCYSDGGITATQVNGQANIDLNGFGTDPWSVQFSQDGFNFDPNQEYEISFKAKSSIPRSFGVDVEGANYYRYLDKTDDLTTDMQTYTYDFTVNKDEKTKLNFFFGKTSTDVDNTVPYKINIDDVVITKVSN